MVHLVSTETHCPARPSAAHADCVPGGLIRLFQDMRPASPRPLRFGNSEPEKRVGHESATRATERRSAGRRGTDRRPPPRPRASCACSGNAGPSRFSCHGRSGPACRPARNVSTGRPIETASGRRLKAAAHIVQSALAPTVASPPLCPSRGRASAHRPPALTRPPCKIHGPAACSTQGCTSAYGDVRTLSLLSGFCFMLSFRVACAISSSMFMYRGTHGLR